MNLGEGKALPGKTGLTALDSVDKMGRLTHLFQIGMQDGCELHVQLVQLAFPLASELPLGDSCANTLLPSLLPCSV